MLCTVVHCEMSSVHDTSLIQWFCRKLVEMWAGLLDSNKVPRIRLKNSHFGRKGVFKIKVNDTDRRETNLNIKVNFVPEAPQTHNMSELSMPV